MIARYVDETNTAIVIDYGDRIVSVPVDPANADYADIVARGVVIEQAPSPAVTPYDVKTECGRRIYAIASAPTQINMAAAEAAGRLTEEQSAAFVVGLDWIAAMRAACAALIASGATDYVDDAHWPHCPPEVSALASVF